MNKQIVVIIISLIICSCSDTGTDDPPVVHPPGPELPEYAIIQPEFVFGFEGESKYSYCPSAFEQHDGSVHLFFCGNPDNLIMVDNIFHIKINPDGTQTRPKSVLQPGASGRWDDHHTCDPSVVAGNFSWNGETYKYAMFYLSNMYGVYYNEIGVAFSNDPEADNWTKYPEQIIRKTWPAEGDQLLNNGGKSWGAGQPSVVSLDSAGRLLLTYTIGDMEGTRIVWCEADFSDMDNYVITTPKTMVRTGLMDINNQYPDYTCNSEFAIHKEEDKIVMIRPVQPHPTGYPSYLNVSLEINYMNLSDFMTQTGSWSTLYRITPEDTGYPRNHNAALLRDSYGHITNWEEPVFYYTVSKAEPDVQPMDIYHAEWTYHIWKSKIVRNKTFR